MEAQWGQAESLPEEVEAKLAAHWSWRRRRSARRSYAYDAGEVARGGVFVTLNHDGTVRVERGFIRAEDDAVEEAEPSADAEDETEPGRTEAGTSGSIAPSDEEDG